MNSSILITVDVEDWFQVENFKSWIPFSTWDSLDSRIEQNVHRLLDLFDVIKLDQPQKSKMPTQVKATFFVLGWIAERMPQVIREISARGHEVASHGYNHELCGSIKHRDLEEDLIKSKKLLENIIGSEVYGYRAPSFSIDNTILKVIENCGYLYDSSYNSFSLHGRYGKVTLNGYPKNGIAVKMSENFYELPISNLKFGWPINLNRGSIKDITRDKHLANPSNMNQHHQGKMNIELPWGGGGYFRLIPWPIFKQGLKIILNKDKVILFYLHPWELDPAQPKVGQASALFKFRHYLNLDKTESKLSKLIGRFKECNFLSCSDYVSGLV
jgi:polysaccharide deacetylase family protein (PEP-CTERM system associated)